MATRYTLGSGYAYEWDGSQEPEVVILPKTAEGCTGDADVYEATARRGWVDGVRVVWIDTPVGTFAQLEHMMDPQEI